ncbi:MAG TPA: DUF2950 domain-containing protein [Candidatus Binataceae bacterium]|nr:DUF2950 domain-containing protein [Candidatus Binataceae bacterium]
MISISLVLALGGGAAFAQEPGQKTFSSPSAAADALAAAVESNNDQELLAILGPSARDLISSGDHTADQNRRARFTRKYKQLHQFATAADGRVFLYIGANNWPDPVPLRKNGSQWYFDTKSGRKEVLFRRIGANELSAIKVCQAIAAGEHQYYSSLHDGNSVHQYSPKFHSTPGTQDGLYWPVKAGEKPQSPLGPLVADAAIEGYQHHSGTPPHPFHGYIYRLITQQGASASGGTMNYVVDGKMTGGFALVAYPASYRDSGVMTFIVNQDGQIYQKDLGPQTAQIAAAMTQYNPDKTWRPVTDAAGGAAVK